MMQHKIRRASNAHAHHGSELPSSGLPVTAGVGAGVGATTEVPELSVSHFWVTTFACAAVGDKSAQGGSVQFHDEPAATPPFRNRAHWKSARVVVPTGYQDAFWCTPVFIAHSMFQLQSGLFVLVTSMHVMCST